MYSQCLGISHSIDSGKLKIRMTYRETDSGSTSTEYYAEISNGAAASFSNTPATITKYTISSILASTNLNINTFAAY